MTASPVATTSFPESPPPMPMPMAMAKGSAPPSESQVASSPVGAGSDAATVGLDNGSAPKPKVSAIINNSVLLELQ